MSRTRWTAGRSYTLVIGGGLAAVMIGFGIPPLLDDGSPAAPPASTPAAGQPDAGSSVPAPPTTIAIPRFGETTTTG